MVGELKNYFKLGIVYFVLLSAIAGYGIGHTVEDSFSLVHFLSFLVGTFLISAGSLSLNQFQEIKNDKLMERTQDRPLVKESISKKTALSISLGFILVGELILYAVSPLSAIVGFVIIILYNGIYTLYWKKKWSFAAVPGAIPGALPGVLGFSAVNEHIFSPPSIYLFLVMFLWQMPHFWTLAIRYKDDYAKGNFPVLPAIVGSGRTKYHISFYVWAYALLGLMSPFFVDYHYAYFLMVLPFAALVVYFFLKYFKASEGRAWLPFFLVTNFSMLAFMFAPLIDKWTPILFEI
ncbi:MAG: protoheme IX farnesyltransferase [Halobacteriovoraceae bacterium]|nr:protoheme IX farnesyltransferase [Halobacteriovoraceae bacterium]|tara:strand:- start:3229 stop:4104 length:876 start_codon:yes stop_codon:yes gene_type:complete